MDRPKHFSRPNLRRGPVRGSRSSGAVVVYSGIKNHGPKLALDQGHEFDSVVILPPLLLGGQIRDAANAGGQKRGNISRLLPVVTGSFAAHCRVPDTRSGKIIRRVLGAISNNEDAGDISTLANPEIVDEIRKMKS